MPSREGSGGAAAPAGLNLVVGGGDEAGHVDPTLRRFHLGMFVCRCKAGDGASATATRAPGWAGLARRRWSPGERTGLLVLSPDPLDGGFTGIAL